MRRGVGSRRTVDFGSRGEGRIAGERFGNVVVGAIDVCVFLDATCQHDRIQTFAVRSRWAGRCIAS